MRELPQVSAAQAFDTKARIAPASRWTAGRTFRVGKWVLWGPEDDFGLTDHFDEALEPTIWRGTGAGPPEISDQPRFHGPLQFMRASFDTADDIDGDVVWEQPPMANWALENGDKMRGKVAVVKRGYNVVMGCVVLALMLERTLCARFPSNSC